MLSQLQDIAFRFKIEQDNTLGRAAKVTTVIKVLNDLNTAYLQFLEVEFNKNEEFAKVVQNKPRVLKNLLDDLELLLVDVKFGSFEASVAPALVDSQTLFRDEVLEWEKQTFSLFKNFVLSGDYNQRDFLQETNERYTDRERLKIFKPLFAAFGSGKDYVVSVTNMDGKTEKTLKRPEKNKLDFYLPVIEETPSKESYKTSVIFAKVLDKDSDKLKKGAIKDILYWEEMEHDTYPFKPNLLKHDKIVYVLKEKLDCLVRFDKDYIISCIELGLKASGETREAAEANFAGIFHQLVLDMKQKEDSARLKKRLEELVDSVHQ